MKRIRTLVCLSAALLAVAAPRVVWAQATTAPTTSPTPQPVVVLNSPDSVAGAAADLKGVPPSVAKLIVNFDALRDKYLLQQHLLLEKLQDATTKEERQAIRAQLQANRQGFLDELADFRTQVKVQLKSVQGRVSNAEFIRIIEAAEAASTGNHHHRGN
jgi:hypothetical protein